MLRRSPAAEPKAEYEKVNKDPYVMEFLEINPERLLREIYRDGKV